MAPPLFMKPERQPEVEFGLKSALQPVCVTVIALLVIGMQMTCVLKSRGLMMLLQALIQLPMMRHAIECSRALMGNLPVTNFAT